MYLYGIHYYTLHDIFEQKNYNRSLLQFFSLLVTLVTVARSLCGNLFSVTLLSVCSLLRVFQIVVLISKSRRRFYTFATSTHLFCRNTRTNTIRVRHVCKCHTHVYLHRSHAFFLSSLHTIVNLSYFIGVLVSHRKLTLKNYL